MTKTVSTSKQHSSEFRSEALKLAERISVAAAVRELSLSVSENLLKQDFYANGPNQKWAGDITYLRTDEGCLYLAVVIDLWSRAVIGWSMSPTHDDATGLRCPADGAVAV
ncbi:IS3 element protein InsF [Escherichia coli]|nr:IS3 element protein InsF [Escherichia coli]CAD6109665.1 IS3 element protein InsF [Escherichia coli]